MTGEAARDAPSRSAGPLLNLIARRLAVMNDHIRAIAQRQGAHLVDLKHHWPWVHRRARGRSTGDRRAPERPEPATWREGQPGARADSARSPASSVST